MGTAFLSISAFILFSVLSVSCVFSPPKFGEENFSYWIFVQFYNLFSHLRLLLTVFLGKLWMLNSSKDSLICHLEIIYYQFDLFGNWQRCKVRKDSWANAWLIIHSDYEVVVLPTATASVTPVHVFQILQCFPYLLIFFGALTASERVSVVVQPTLHDHWNPHGKVPLWSQWSAL